MDTRRLLLWSGLTLTVLAGLAARAPAAADTAFRGARRYALVVAGWYEAGSPHGNWYWNVTRGFYGVLRDRYGFWDEDIWFLVHQDRRGDPAVDGFSTVAEIGRAVDQIAAKAQPQDIVVLYFVGHGGTDHFAASDSGLGCATLKTRAAGIRSEHQLWTFSQCRSGLFPGVCAKPGRTVFSSTQYDEDNAMPWAEAVRDAFNFAPGADENGDGLISFGEAYHFARRAQIAHYGSEAKLQEHSQFCDCGCQHPTTGVLPHGPHGATALKENLGPPLGQVQVGVIAAATDGQRVTYPKPFAGVATVLCAAQVDGQPLAACAVDNTAKDFVLVMQSPTGQRVTKAQVVWVACLPGAATTLQAGHQWIAHSRERIRFPRRFANLPLVVCNAQRQGGALVAGATRFDQDGFDVRVTNLPGQPVEGSWLLWVAAEPGIEHASLRIGGGYLANYPHGGARPVFDPVSFDSEVMVASAAWDDAGRRILVDRGPRDHVNLKVLRSETQVAASSWCGHYLSFRVNPALSLVNPPLRRLP